MMEGIQTINVPLRWIKKGEKRFDASFYAQDVVKARKLVDKLRKKGIQINQVGKLSKRIFWPDRFKRHYVSKDKGEPFLTPSEVFMFLPKANKYVINYPKNVSVKDGWLLITRSGTVGRCLIATSFIQNFVLSDDLIRIIPKENERIGYLYAYLNTWVGQSLLTKDKYGTTVKHIEPHHVAGIPIPRIPELENEINQKIIEAHKLRREAQELLLKAEEILYSKLELPKIDKDDVDYFSGEIGKLIKACEVRVGELRSRLDASYHAPILRLIKSNLKSVEEKDNYKLKRLGDGVATVFDLPTYKRIYVGSKEGYPILSGVHLKQMKLYDLKYISELSFHKGGESLVDKYKIRKGWILTTERGTTGISALVTKAWDGWLASHNILRIVPKDINPGYLLAYLNTDYAQLQLKSKELGAVVEVLDPRDMEDIILPVPSRDKQDEIGNLIFQAYYRKDKANQIEDETIKLFEEKLEEIAEGK